MSDDSTYCKNLKIPFLHFRISSDLKSFANSRPLIFKSFSRSLVHFNNFIKAIFKTKYRFFNIKFEMFRSLLMCFYYPAVDRLSQSLYSLDLPTWPK